MNYTGITILGISFIFVMSVLGAALVFLVPKEISSKLNAMFLGFSAGVMLAASVWSLLLPALEQAEKYWGVYACLVVTLGILFGGIVLVAIEKITLKLRNGAGELGSANKLFLAVTLHNIPEGLAVGFAFGGAFALRDSTAYIMALGLALGIGIQNFPEGAAVALPLKQQLRSRKKAFLWGVVSGIVEPIFAIIGYFLATQLVFIQPWLLAFSAGAMLFVVAEELLPAAGENRERRIAAWGALLGFALMMTFDVVFG